jgi:hypothetical protein
MPRTRKEAPAQTKDVMLTIPIERRHDSLTKVAAARDGRSVSGWVRYLILQELQKQALVDENFAPTDSTEQAS